MKRTIGEHTIQKISNTYCFYDTSQIFFLKVIIEICLMYELLKENLFLPSTFFRTWQEKKVFPSILMVTVKSFFRDKKGLAGIFMINFFWCHQPQRLLTKMTDISVFYIKQDWQMLVLRIFKFLQPLDFLKIIWATEKNFH